MLLYTIELEGDFITFVGIAGTPEEGKKKSHRKTLIKEVRTKTSVDGLLLISVDDDTTEYDYTEVVDPGTGLVFTTLVVFRSYMLTNLTV